MFVDEIAKILVDKPKSIGKLLLDKKVTPEEVRNAVTIMNEGVEYANSAVELYEGMLMLREYRAGDDKDKDMLNKALDKIKSA